MQQLFKRKYASLKKRNRKRGGGKIDFTWEYLEQLWTGKCAISGIDISFDLGYNDDSYPQIDKIDPKKGYVKGNIAWVSRRCNRLKQDGDIDTVKSLLKYLKKGPSVK